jgi:hypothetical protein
MAKPQIRTGLLILVNMSLIALVGFVWKTGQQRVHEPENVAVHYQAVPDVAILEAATPPPSLDGATIRDQAVFHSRRSFYHPSPSTDAVPAPDYDLAGTMELPQGKRIAFVKRKSDKSSRTVHVGDDLEGWQVQLIEANRVVVVRADQQIELHTAGVGASPGLVRGNAGPHVAQTGIRVLGAQGPATAIDSRPTVTQVRTYQPPPH